MKADEEEIEKRKNSKIYKRQKIVMQVLERYKFIFRKIPVPVIIFGLTDDGLPSQVLDANDNFLKTSGYSQEEINQINAIDIFDIKNINRVKEMINLLLKKANYNGKLTFYFEKKKLNSEFFAKATLEKFNEHKIVIMLLTSKDY